MSRKISVPNYYIGIVLILQVFFAKKSRKMQHLQAKTQPWPGNPALIRFYVHQNDVRADPLDAIPGDHEVVPGAQQPEKPAGAGHHDGVDAPLGQLDDGVADKAQPPSVVDADDLLAVQVRKFM
jgi:hypothetical protein